MRYISDALWFCRFAEPAPTVLYTGYMTWLDHLVRRGHTGIPPFAVIDIMACVGETRAPWDDMGELPGPLRTLLARYSRAMSDLASCEKFEPVLRGARARNAFLAVIREFLLILAREVERRASILFAFRISDLEEMGTEPWDIPGRKKLLAYPGGWEAFVTALEDAVASWTRRAPVQDADAVSRLFQSPVDVDLLRLIAALRSEDMPISWDFEAIEAAQQIMKEPVVEEYEETRLFARAPNLRVEKVRVRSRLPGGGYVGLRQNGGIEEISSVAPSELAFPLEIIIHKALNRQLAVFERPVQFARARRLAFCGVVTDSRLLDTRRSGPASSPKAQLAAVLARLLKEFSVLAARWRGGIMQATFLFPRYTVSLALSDLTEIAPREGLPFFLDHDRSNGFANIFVRALDTPGQWDNHETEGHSQDWSERINKSILNADGACVVRFTRAGEEWTDDDIGRFLESRLDMGAGAWDMLWEASLNPGGWFLNGPGKKARGRPRALRDIDIVRKITRAFIERITGIRVDSLSVPGGGRHE